MSERSINIRLGLVAILFFWKALGGEVMGPEVYGAAVYFMPAEMWAAFIFSASVLVNVGLYIGGIGGAFLRIAGNSVMLSVFAAFTYWSSSATYGDVVVAFSLVYFMTQCIELIIHNCRDLREMEWK